MRKFILLITISFLFVSCSDFYNGVIRSTVVPDVTTDEITFSNYVNKNLMAGLRTKNADLVKKSFGSDLLNDPMIDEKIQKLFDSISGTIIPETYPPKEHGTGMLNYGKNVYCGDYYLIFCTEQDDGTRHYYDLYYNLMYRNDFYPQRKGIYELSVIDEVFSACLTENKYNEKNPVYNLSELHRDGEETGFYMDIGNTPFPDGYDEIRQIRGELVFYNKSESEINYEQLREYLNRTSFPSDFTEVFGKPNAHSWYANYWQLDNGKYLAVSVYDEGKVYIFMECDKKKVLKDICTKNKK